MYSNAFRLAGCGIGALMALLFLFTPPDIDIVILTPSNAQYVLSRVLYEISQAQRTIDIATFILTNDRIISALRTKHRQGVRVNVLYGDVSLFPGTKVFGLHMKLMVIDGVRVITGSANFTDAAFGHNSEILMFMNSTEFNSYFRRFYVLVAPCGQDVLDPC